MTPPVGPTSVAVARFVVDVGRRLVSRAADGLVSGVVWVWRTYWTGSLVAAVVILGVGAILLNLAVSGLGATDVWQTVGTVMALLLVLKVFALALIPRKR